MYRQEGLQITHSNYVLPRWKTFYTEWNSISPTGSGDLMESEATKNINK